MTAASGMNVRLSLLDYTRFFKENNFDAARARQQVLDRAGARRKLDDDVELNGMRADIQLAAEKFTALAGIMGQIEGGVGLANPDVVIALADQALEMNAGMEELVGKLANLFVGPLFAYYLGHKIPSLAVMAAWEITVPAEWDQPNHHRECILLD